MTIGIGYGGATFPATESLRMSENGTCYDWNEAVIFKHDETGRYAFYSGSGCSCNYLEEEYSEGFFKHELVWTPERSPVVLEMSLWIRGLDASEHVEKFDRLQAWLASGN